jgi:hypothetical protein
VAQTLATGLLTVAVMIVVTRLRHRLRHTLLLFGW